LIASKIQLSKVLIFYSLSKPPVGFVNFKITILAEIANSVIT